MLSSTLCFHGPTSPVPCFHAPMSLVPYVLKAILYHYPASMALYPQYPIFQWPSVPSTLCFHSLMSSVHYNNSLVSSCTTCFSDSVSPVCYVSMGLCPQYPMFPWLCVTSTLCFHDPMLPAPYVFTGLDPRTL